ncbi:MAG: hypothetical protein H8D97_01865 [Proteobacteria bacterium]|nr:hypothetical protein [Pseudomonadota bacterium]
MIYTEVNELLRFVSRKIMAMDYKKTQIGKIIFGSGNYPMFLRFIDENKEQDLGIKPLTKAADVTGHEIRLVFVDPSIHDPIVDEIENRNKKYILKLEESLVDILGEYSKEKRTRKTSLDDALNNVLNLDNMLLLDD